MTQETQYERVHCTKVEAQTLPWDRMFPKVYGSGESMCDMVVDVKEFRALKLQKLWLAGELSCNTQFVLPSEKQKGNLNMSLNCFKFIK